MSMNDPLSDMLSRIRNGQSAGKATIEVPSNVILEKVGARGWICRIMLTWGLVSMATAFAQGPLSFYILRFLLGLAEAGFFPGMILFFTYWFPPVHRGRIIAGFMTAIPISIALGAPVLTSIMELNGFLGLAGWKWLFLIEAAPAVLLGLSCLLFLTDRPEKAGWLAADEKAWLAGELQKEHPRWTDQQLYEDARKINIAQYQEIIYTQYLPDLLGPGALPSYTGYNANVDPAIATDPLVGRSRPASRCISVDLPEPDGPMTATKRPLGTSSVTPRSASTAASPSP